MTEPSVSVEELTRDWPVVDPQTGRPLARFFAGCVFPLDVASVDRRVICTPDDNTLHERLPLPLLYRYRHTSMIAGAITAIMLVPPGDGKPGQLRMLGTFALRNVAGRELSGRVSRGESVPVGAEVDAPQPPEIMGEPPELTFWFRRWKLRAVLADPRDGAAWEQACIWRA